jgi:hypothetical protein
LPIGHAHSKSLTFAHSLWGCERQCRASCLVDRREHVEALAAY